MMYIILIVSVLLDQVFLSLIQNHSVLFPLFTLMSLIVIYPFFRKSQYHAYLSIALFLGGVYDIVYMNTLFLNLGLFLLVGILIKFFFKVFSINLINNTIVGIIIILLYRSVTYFILLCSGYLNWSFSLFIKGIYSSLIVNLMYVIVIHLVLLLMSHKFKIRRFR